MKLCPYDVTNRRRSLPPLIYRVKEENIRMFRKNKELERLSKYDYSDLLREEFHEIIMTPKQKGLPGSYFYFRRNTRSVMIRSVEAILQVYEIHGIFMIEEIQKVLLHAL